MYGSGFPKSASVSKAIDKAAGAEREVVGSKIGQPGYSLAPNDNAHTPTYGTFGDSEGECAITAPATPEAATWDGWGTALKPAWEPITLCRKPIKGTVAANVLTHGTGAINVDACRVGTDEELGRPQGTMPQPMDWGNTSPGDGYVSVGNARGRWPANVILDPDAAAILDQQSGESTSPPVGNVTRTKAADGFGTFATGDRVIMNGHGDSGGASRFFYTPKADANERPRVNGVSHPTVKPVDLMAWLCRLITPPGGTILDPFAGSGTTLEAAIVERFRVIGIEREADYIPLIMQRLTRGIEVTLL
jgi:site-specific DNA-methyltransferase (adenine-specific)